MKDSLKSGIEYEFSFVISERKTVPALYPEASEFRAMPEVFATGYLVGFLEWACIKAINPHIDWPREQSVGTLIDVNHIAATSSGMTVTAKVKVLEVDGRRIVFDVKAFDNLELISEGRHERFVIYPDKFNKKVKEKAVRANI